MRRRLASLMRMRRAFRGARRGPSRERRWQPEPAVGGTRRAEFGLTPGNAARDHVTVFYVDNFIAECQVARREDEPRLAVRDVVQRAVSGGAAVGDVLCPAEAGFTMLHHDDELTILHVVWAPHMSIYPHDHAMWAVIGIYAGQEDNAFFRRERPGARMLVESGGKQLREREVAAARRRHHPRRHQPTRRVDGGDPRLRRRLRERAAEPVGAWPARGAALRHRGGPPAVRRSQRGLARCAPNTDP